MTELTDFWPNQQKTARLLGVDPATVLRWVEDLPTEDQIVTVRTARGKLLPPRLVLRLAEQHGKDVYDPADALLQGADLVDDDDARNAIRDEVNTYLSGYENRRDPARRLTMGELMNDLRAILPPRVYREIEEHFTVQHR